MVYCICRGVSLERIREKLESGEDLTQVFEALEVGTDCGICLGVKDACLKQCSKGSMGAGSRENKTTT